MSRTASCRKISSGSSSVSSTSRSWSSYQPPSAIAFWKMVGFEVTPTTASSSSIRCSSPVSSHSRESESIQTDCPSSESWCRRDSAMCALHLLDFRKPAHVALPTVEPGAEESADQLSRQVRPHHSRADAEHVHVVVLDALVRRVRVVTGRGPDARELRRGDRGARTRPADEDCTLGQPAANRVADLLGLVRIVDHRLRPVGAEVDGLVPAADELLHDPLAELHPAVVEGDGDFHSAPLCRTAVSIRSILPSRIVKAPSTSVRYATSPLSRQR